MLGVALLGVLLTYVGVYFVATHGPRLFGARVLWFDGTGSLLQKLGLALQSIGLTLVLCLLVGFLASLGIPNETATTRVTVAPDSPAERGGLRSDDVVAAIGTERVESFDQIQEKVRASEGPLQLEVRRGNETLRFPVQPVDQRIGVSSVMQKEPRTLASAAEFSVGVFGAVAKNALLPSPSASTFSGPVGIVRETSRQGQGPSLLFLLLVLHAGVLFVVPLLHAFDLGTFGLYRMRSNQSPHGRDVFNLLVLGATILALSGWTVFLAWQSVDGGEIPLLDLLVNACGLALSLASFTALKRHLSIRRAGALAAVGALVGPVLWVGTLIWISRRKSVT